MPLNNNVNNQKPKGGYPIALFGESGQGKSTSFRNLDPNTTYFINADQKGLPWKGWRRDWIEGKNYIQTSDPNSIQQWIRHVSFHVPHIRTLVIDTVSSIMIDSEMARAREKGFNKWELAKTIYDLIRTGLNVRSNLHIIYVFHSETLRGLDGESWTHIKTSGQKLEKIGIESRFPVVLLAKSYRDDKGPHYVFETQALRSTAKTPNGMFANFEIPNDMALVLETIDSYELGNDPNKQPQQQQTIQVDVQHLGPKYQEPLQEWLEANRVSLSELGQIKFSKVQERVNKIKCLQQQAGQG